jgi:hypothetical protein
MVLETPESSCNIEEVRMDATHIQWVSVGCPAGSGGATRVVWGQTMGTGGSRTPGGDEWEELCYTYGDSEPQPASSPKNVVVTYRTPP